MSKESEICSSSFLGLERNDLNGDIYVCQALWEGRRLDGRGWMDTRDLSVSFGSDWGSCQVAVKTVLNYHMPPHMLCNSHIDC